MRQWWAYSSVIVATVAVVALRYAHDEADDTHHNFLLPFIVPIMVAGWVGGIRCCACATALNAALMIFLFTEPRYDFRIDSSADALRLGLYVCICVFIGVLAEARQRSRRQVEVDRAIANRRRAELESEIADRLATEKRLFASERRYKALIQATPQVVWSIGGNDNEALNWWGKLTGQTAAELSGLGWLDAVHADDRDRVRETWERALEQNFLYDTQYRIRTQAGQYRHFSVRGVALCDTAGRLEEWIGSLTDIHDRTVAEEGLRELNATLEARVAERTAALHVSDRRFRAIFHSQFQFIGLLAPTGELLEANRTALASVGVSEESVLGRPFWETAWWAHDAVQQNRLRMAVVNAAAGTADRFEATHVSADGALIWVDFSLTPFADESGRIVLLIPEGRDITERKAMETQLKRSESLHRSVIESLMEGIVVQDATGVIVATNGRAERILGLTQDQICGRDSLDPRWRAVREDGSPFPGEEHPAMVCLRTARPVLGTVMGIHRADGDLTWIVVNAHPIQDSPDTLTGAVASFQDISERKHAEEASREQEERFRSAFDFAPIGIALVSLSGAWLRVNRSVCELLGYAEAELLATDFQTLTHPNDLGPDLDSFRQMLDGSLRTYQIDKRYFHKTGRIVRVLLSVSLVRDAAAQPRYFIKQIVDITERKAAEERIKAALQEKETLLKEVHHRVKNNLQVVSSLLDLQSEHTADPAALVMFQQSRRRVKSMAMIHDRLHRASDLARVDFGEYAKQLTDDLFHGYRVDRADIALELDIGAVTLPLDLAIPCGLLLNELMSNCLKHAFRGRTDGRIRLSLYTKTHSIVLSVTDDGVGFPAGADFRNTTSFGMQLINTLVEQLNGEIELVAGKGTTITVCFASGSS